MMFKSIAKYILSRFAYFLLMGKFLALIDRLLFKKRLLIVLTYHRVNDWLRTKDLPASYDRGLDYSIFRIQIETLTKYFNVIDEETFINIVKNKQNLNKSSVLITFDDADSDFIKYALPILRENNCPAVMFVPVAYVESSDRFWHLRLSNLFYEMKQEDWLKIKNDGFVNNINVRNILDSENNFTGNKKIIFKSLITLLNKMHFSDVENIIGSWEKILGFDYNIGIKSMHWDELDSLKNYNLSIGSHSLNHNKFEQLEKEDAIFELSESKYILENKLKVNIRSFCYPGGSYKNETLDLVKDAGYQVSFSTDNGACNYPLNGKMIYKIPRMGVRGENKYEVNLYLCQLLLRKVLGRL